MASQVRRHNKNNSVWTIEFVVNLLLQFCKDTILKIFPYLCSFIMTEWSSVSRLNFRLMFSFHNIYRFIYESSPVKSRSDRTRKKSCKPQQMYYVLLSIEFLPNSRLYFKFFIFLWTKPSKLIGLFIISDRYTNFFLLSNFFAYIIGRNLVLNSIHFGEAYW